jgi:hypothetical protein
MGDTMPMISIGSPRLIWPLPSSAVSGEAF